MSPSDEPFLSLVRRFSDGLNARTDQFDCFAKYAVQIEGWLKGEALCFLDAEQRRGVVARVGREVRVATKSGRKQCDLSISFRDTPQDEVWIELKHWFISRQGSWSYNAKAYCSDRTSVGIMPDVEKLNRFPGTSRYLLILATPNPGPEDWVAGVELFNKKFKPLRVMRLTNPIDFPSQFFLGVLKV